MTRPISSDTLRDALHVDPADPGCDFTAPLEEYVELELSGGDPATAFASLTAHLRSCPACRADHDGLLELAREVGDAAPLE